jgi:hypothetical protein
MEKNKLSLYISRNAIPRRIAKSDMVMAMMMEGAQER